MEKSSGSAETSAEMQSLLDNFKKSFAQTLFKGSKLDGRLDFKKFPLRDIQ